MNRFIKVLTLIGVIGGFGSGLMAQTTLDRIINTDTTLTADTVWVINGYTFVTEGATLTIEPGTTIIARLAENITSGDPASALVITAGSKIDAQGTASMPIVFTSEVDQPLGTGGAGDTRLWGGLVILGNAVINSRADGGDIGDPVVDQIEGFSLTAEQQDLITYGGTDDADNSGTLRYVSIRHGGFDLGGGNEINGLTMGGVGSGTTVEYVEVFAGKDDGIECFGGTVNIKYASVAFNRDDSLDLDLGYRGNVQFFFTIGRFFTSAESANAGDEGMDKGGEWDGATSPLNATPVADYTLYNGTFIGMGDTGSNTAFHMRDNAVITLKNSIATDFETMLEVDDPFDVDTTSVLPTIENNIWWSHISANNTAAGLNDPGGDLDATSVFTSAGNRIVAPMLGGISREPDGGLDPTPMAGSPALFGAAAVPDDSFFTQTSYVGAFAEGHNWLMGWTALDLLGYLGEPASSGPLMNQLLSISTRGFLETGNTPGNGFNFLNAGFIIEGTEPLDVVIRGRAQSLNLPDGTVKAADPVLDLVRIGEGVIASNDDYTQAANIDMLTGTSLDPADVGMDNTEAALVMLDLAPGSYTARLSVSGDTAGGVAIVEVISVE